MEFNKKHMSPLNSQKIRVNGINVFPKLCSRSVNRSRIRHDGFPNPPGSSPVFLRFSPNQTGAQWWRDGDRSARSRLCHECERWRETSPDPASATNQTITAFYLSDLFHHLMKTETLIGRFVLYDWRMIVGCIFVW